MVPLAVMTCAGFSGYALLLPVAPLWVVGGGAGTAGAGLVNGVLLLATVLTQLLVPRALQRFGWGPVLAAGLALLGAPGVLMSLGDALAPVLVLSAARGVGFGVLTVTGSAAAAALVDPDRRGEAIGAYGLAVALPNLVLLPAGPWIADRLGWAVAFGLSALPVLGIPAALRLAAVLREHHAAAPETEDRHPDPGARLRLLRPMVLLLVVTLAGGALLTFVPQVVDSAVVAAGGLLLMGLAGALGRWRVGVLADRHGPQRFLVPLVPLTGVGMAVVAWSVAGVEVRVPAFLLGMLVVGLCYGALQNLTLVISFAAVERRDHNLASAVWNIGFDGGTALGSVAVGVVAGATSFATAFALAGLVAAATLPLALRPRTSSAASRPGAA
ncbi:MFS transporter [Nocardioides zeicaulis]